MAQSKSLHQWSTQDLISWIDRKQLPSAIKHKIKRAILQNDISGDDLSMIGCYEDLVDLGIPRFAAKRFYKLLQEIDDNCKTNKINYPPKRGGTHEKKEAEDIIDKYPISYDKVYIATAIADAKAVYKFQHKCQYKGCNNIPIINKNELQGDLYICQKHRIEMANDLQKQAIKNGFISDNFKKLVESLKNLNDKQLLTESQNCDLAKESDYYAKYYSHVTCKQYVICKLLSHPNMTPNTSKYWDLMQEYLLLQETGRLLTIIRKISNPWLLLVGAACFAAGVIIGLCCSGGSGSNNDEYDEYDEREEQRKRDEREEQRKRDERAKQIKLVNELNDQILNNDNIIKTCEIDIEGAKNRINELKNTLKQRQIYTDQLKKGLDEVNAEINTMASRQVNFNEEIRRAERETQAMQNALADIDTELREENERLRAQTNATNMNVMESMYDRLIEIDKKRFQAQTALDTARSNQANTTQKQNNFNQYVASRKLILESEKKEKERKIRDSKALSKLEQAEKQKQQQQQNDEKKRKRNLQYNQAVKKAEALCRATDSDKYDCIYVAYMRGKLKNFQHKGGVVNKEYKKFGDFNVLKWETKKLNISANLNFDNIISDWSCKRICEFISNENPDLGVLVYQVDGRSHHWCKITGGKKVWTIGNKNIYFGGI